MALITQTDIENKLGRSLTSEEESTFIITNTALQYLVEDMIGSSLEEVDAATRYYDGGVQHLSIDPCTDITAVKYVDDEQNAVLTLDAIDYTKEPINNTLKTMIRHRSIFQTGINNIAVTAKFSINGDARTLAIVKEALIQAVASEVVSTDNIKKESIEGYSIEYATTETKNALSTIEYLFPRI